MPRKNWACTRNTSRNILPPRIKIIRARSILSKPPLPLLEGANLLKG
jgi:hypothetical protein